MLIEEDTMSTTTIAPTASTRTARSSRIANVATWVLQAVIGVQFFFGGGLKLAGSPVMVDLFTEIGAGQWLRYLVGALEVAGGVGLLIRPLSGLAAAGLAGVMVGAVVTNVAIIGENPTLPAIYLVLCAVIAWRRRERTAELVRRFRR
jgi:putative oxidoreductase